MIQATSARSPSVVLIADDTPACTICPSWPAEQNKQRSTLQGRRGV